LLKAHFQDSLGDPVTCVYQKKIVHVFTVTNESVSVAQWARPVRLLA